MYVYDSKRVCGVVAIEAVFILLQSDATELHGEPFLKQTCRRGPFFSEECI